MSSLGLWRKRRRTLGEEAAIGESAGRPAGWLAQTDDRRATTGDDNGGRDRLIGPVGAASRCGRRLNPN